MPRVDPDADHDPLVDAAAAVVSDESALDVDGRLDRVDGAGESHQERVADGLYRSKLRAPLAYRVSATSCEAMSITLSPYRASATFRGVFAKRKPFDTSAS
jgi:hypothetical protein